MVERNQAVSLKRTPCPFCGEKILENARKCRYCGEWLNRKSKFSLFSIKKIRLGKWSIFLVILILLFSLFLIENYKAKINTSTPNNEEGLRQTINRQYSLLNSDEGIREIYRNYLAPEIKKGTVDEYVADYKESRKKWGYEFTKVDVHGLSIDKNIGFVDRTIFECKDSSCGEIINQHRSFKKYVYYNDRWLMSEDYRCPRDEMYSMVPEFERAINLILQRTNYVDVYSAIINCVNVEYSEDKKTLDGAEGVFQFIEGQSPEKLEIFVSPRYSAKDDLITAMLVAHELTHAANYVGRLWDGEQVDCYKDEAWAFNNQNALFNSFNAEEQASFNARLQQGGSIELQNIRDAYNKIPQFSGETYIEKAENYVKVNPHYQKQCAGRSSSSNEKTLASPEPVIVPQPVAQKEDKVSCINRAKTKADACLNQCTQKGYSDLDNCKLSYPADQYNYTRCADNAMAVATSCQSNCTAQFNIEGAKCL